VIREKDIARIFALILLIGLVCVGYVLLTQPTGMIAYQTYDTIEPVSKETMSEEEVLSIFEEEWDSVKDKLIMLGEIEE
jgi:hypothetical protein